MTPQSLQMFNYAQTLPVYLLSHSLFSIDKSVLLLICSVSLGMPKKTCVCFEKELNKQNESNESLGLKRFFLMVNDFTADFTS